MKERYERCVARMKDITALAQAAGVIGWDHHTMMPARGGAARGAQQAALSAVIHEKIIHPELGEDLKILSGESSLSEDEHVCVREWLRDHERSVRIPERLVRELAETTTLANEAWAEARRISRYATFAPWLEKVLVLKRQQAEALGYQDEPYDALLDDYEPGMTAAQLDPLVRTVCEGVVPIVAAIREAGKGPDERPLHRRCPEEAQERLCRELMAKLGLDPQASRLDRSVHPFCCGICPTDVRITTRYDERWFPQALFGVMHETGHGLYEQGLPEKYIGTPLAEAVSLGVHESQSRLWENCVGRSEAFMRFVLPLLRRRFPAAMKGVKVRMLYRAVNRVKPSFIRVEADEVTYSLHIALRYELERALLSGHLSVKELPGAWNDGMQRLLGIRPKRDADGVLQDTHWSEGMIGYFPTYLLGNLYAAQQWAAIQSSVRGVEGRVAQGQFAPILSWLRRRIHVHGRRFKPAELIERATGEPPSASFFRDYLAVKYGALYELA